MECHEECFGNKAITGVNWILPFETIAGIPLSIRQYTSSIFQKHDASPCLLPAVLCSSTPVTPPAATGESEFRWFITFVFFRTAFACNEQILYQLLSQKAPDNMLKIHDWTLGKAYRVLSGHIVTTATHYRAFDLLDAMNTLLNRQQYSLYETGRESLTTYHDRPFISTYGQKADLINPTLLFAILKDIGELFAGQIADTATPAKFRSAAPGPKSSHR